MDRLTTMTTFTAVATSGSFAEAARRLNLSPALVSKHVQALEDRLVRASSTARPARSA